ncbi:MAG: hypothetical protein AB7E47_02200 [Desulfovibrionaceae bacterium]
MPTITVTISTPAHVSEADLLTYVRESFCSAVEQSSLPDDVYDTLADPDVPVRVVRQVVVGGPTLRLPGGGLAMSMKISLPGVLKRAANSVRKSKDAQHLELPLLTLLEHLQTVRERYALGDTSVVGEFFNVWRD